MYVLDDYFREISLFSDLFTEMNTLSREVRDAVNIGNIMDDPVQDISSIVRFRQRLENVIEGYGLECKFL